jgi:N-acetylglucosaminyldiphosphoundecaprenol N-acetyl-beta-D-mannosaminyltransferase
MINWFWYAVMSLKSLLLIDDPMNIQTTNVLGVQVSAINIPVALQTIDEWVQTREPHYVCVTGVHGVMESQLDEKLLRIHNQAGLVTPDGMPLVWISRARGFHSVSRVYGPDLMLAVFSESVKKGYRHFFYGGNEGVAESLKNRFLEKFPGVQIVGTYTPPFKPLSDEENIYIVERIQSCAPDIVWVGLSTPKQEYWMAEFIEDLQVPVLIGVGAAFDFHSGKKKQAPLWMQHSGLEWFFRMVTEPRRLWKRYMVNNPRFVLLYLAQELGLRKYN